MFQNVVVWDLETVPDLKGFAAAKNLVGKSDHDLRAELGDKFPKHIYHSIVCIGALVAHYDGGSWILVVAPPAFVTSTANRCGSRPDANDGTGAAQARRCRRWQSADARRTSRLDDIVHHLGLALGGRPAAMFAKRLMLPVSNDTLFRVIRRRSRRPSDALMRAERYATTVTGSWMSASRFAPCSC
jgi:hypothetical protein